MSILYGRLDKAAKIKFEPLGRDDLNPVVTVANPSDGTFRLSLPRCTYWKTYVNGVLTWLLDVPQDEGEYDVEQAVRTRYRPDTEDPIQKLNLATRDFVETSLAAQRFLHRQDTPANLWTVHHGLGRFPSVQIIDSEGKVVTTDVRHINPAELELNFAGPAFSGIAILT